jgi:hypothetical protein
VLSILIWWAVPVTAGVLAAVVFGVTRRVRAARGDVETLDRYQRARAALAEASRDGVAVRSRRDQRTGMREE